MNERLDCNRPENFHTPLSAAHGKCDKKKKSKATTRSLFLVTPSNPPCTAVHCWCSRVPLSHSSFTAVLLLPPLCPMARSPPQLQRQADIAILLGLIVFRAINACLVRTYFSPDEYWQALEVAHRITFGYGYLTWEWAVALRSVLHPALFAGVYKVLAAAHLDDGPLYVMYMQLRLSRWIVFATPHPTPCMQTPSCRGIT